MDLIIINGTIYTADESFTKTESFAVSNGKVVATGSTEYITGRFTCDSVIDAQGLFIYPGFNDAHCHFNGYGQNLVQYADLRGTSGPAEIVEILQAHHNRAGGEWILGRSWDQNDWEIAEFPDKAVLDSIFPDIPVYLIRVDGHAGWCNSRALDLAGIDSGTKVDGGFVVLKNGQPSGILIDNAMGLVSKILPALSGEQQAKALLMAQENCFAAGITSVTDCGVDKETIMLMKKMQKQGKLKIRINAMLNPSTETLEHFLKAGPQQADRLVVNTIKIYADGALGSRGALLLEDYSDDDGNRGLQIGPQEYYDRICQMALDHNFAVATHCIGDSANRLILNTYGRYLKGKNNRRWRIEHAQIINPADFEKYARYSVIPSIQATHCTSDMNWAGERLGPERIRGAYAYQTLLKQNGWLPNGTDFPVEEINPFYTFYASVFRADHSGWPDGGWQPDEGLTREQALKSMTIWGAKASFEESLKGSIEPGKWADFIITDCDLMNASPDMVLNAQINSTWIAGERVF